MNVRRAALALAAVGCALAIGGSATERFGIGRPPTAAELQAWDIDVAPNGDGLPPGSGTALAGERIFSARCARCHGVPPRSDLNGPDPRAIGSFWPYATTLFDYVRRAMPQDKPQSLAPREVYALTAYLLSVNGVVPRSARLDRDSLPRVKMPNRAGFVLRDPRPDVR